MTILTFKGFGGVRLQAEIAGDENDSTILLIHGAGHAIYDGGDHFLLVGEVIRAKFEPRRDPLLYFRGKYRRLHIA